MWEEEHNQLGGILMEEENAFFKNKTSKEMKR